MKVNEIIHPVVIESFLKWAEARKNHKYVIMEAAIIFEGGYENLMDVMITVTAPVDLKISRTMQRDNCDKSSVLSRMKTQLDDDIKIKKSDFVIYNDEKKLILPQIIDIHQQLLTLVK